MFDKGFGRDNHARQGLCTSIRSWHVLTSGVICLRLKRTQKSLMFDTGHHWTSLDIASHSNSILSDHILSAYASNFPAEIGNNHKGGPSTDNWLRMLDASIL